MAVGKTKVNCHEHVEPMQWRHLDVYNKECVIVCALPLGCRGNDGKVNRFSPPWEGRSKHFTQEFEAFALNLMREMPVRRVGQTLGEERLSDVADPLRPREGGARVLKLRQRGVGGCGRDGPAQRVHYLMVFADLLAQGVLFTKPGKYASDFGSIC